MIKYFIIFVWFKDLISQLTGKIHLNSLSLFIAFVQKKISDSLRKKVQGPADYVDFQDFYIFGLRW